MDIEQKIARGVEANSIINNELFKSAFDEINQEILDQWQTSPARDVEGREKLYLMLKIAEKFRSNLTRVIDTGKIAQMELGRIRTAQERRAEYLGLDEEL